MLGQVHYFSVTLMLMTCTLTFSKSGGILCTNPFHSTLSFVPQMCVSLLTSCFSTQSSARDIIMLALVTHL